MIRQTEKSLLQFTRNFDQRPHIIHPARSIFRMPPKGTECVLPTITQNLKEMTWLATKGITRKIRFSAFFPLLVMLFGTTVQAEDVVLSWNRPDDARVTGYEIYYGPAENDDFKSSPKEIIPGPEQTNCDIIGLIKGETYAFAAKSVDKFGNKSVFSEVIFYQVSNEQNSNQNDNTDGKNDNNDQDDNTDDNEKDDNDQNNNSTNNAGGGGGGGCFIRILSNPTDQTASEIKTIHPNRF